MVKSVALGAQSRSRDFQESFVHRAVRFVAVQAILTHGGMLEQEWSPLFGMALIASVIDRIFAQQRFGKGTVWIMAIRAHHFAFAQRHVGGAEHLRAPVLMTLEAGVRLECSLYL